MKRPLFVFCLLFLASVAAAQLGGGLSGFAPAAGVLLLCACLPRKRSRAARQLLLCGALASLLALPLVGGLRLRLERWQRLEGQTLPFTAWVEEESPYSPGRFTLRGKAAKNGRQERVRLDLWGWTEETPLPGQWFAGEFLVLEARTDGDAPGGVTLLGVMAGEPEAISAPKGFHPLAAMAALRSRLAQRVWEESPGEATAVILGMVFSLPERIPAQRMEELNQAGLRHLLAVSGLHLSILTGWLRRRNSPEPVGIPAALAALLLTWLMAGLAGFSPSVLRAAGMTSLVLLGQLFSRQADSLTSLGIAGAVLCAFSPPAIFRAGFQLTFTATLGILLGNGPLLALLENGWASRFGPPGPRGGRFLGGLSVCICAQLGALPVLAALFGSFTLWGLVFTLPAIPLVTGILLLGGTGAALLSVSFLAPAGSLLLGAARVPARLFLLLGRVASYLPGTSFPVLTWWQLAFCALLPAGAFLLLARLPRMSRRRGRPVFWGSLFLAALSLGLLWLPVRMGTVVSVRDGGTVIIAAPAGTLVLDAGESGWERRALSAQLLRCGARDPLVLASSGEVSLNALAWQQQELSPAALYLRREDIGLLAGQLPGNYLPLGPEQAEVLPGVFLRQPGEGMLLVETGERKMLKSQISYAIIVQSPLLGEADLVIDCYGGIYTGRNGPRLHRMPTGDCNLLLGG